VNLAPGVAEPAMSRREGVMKPLREISSALIGLFALICSSVPALGGVHLWRVKEVFSNPDGTIQFIEIATCCASTTETNLANQPVTSTTHTFRFPANVVGPTLNKHVLLATQGFKALPGAPAPDHIIADNFFSTSADTITFAVYDTLVFSAGQLPADGTTSLNKNPDDNTDRLFTALNSPTNYAGQTGSVSATPGPPGVPDGSGATTPVSVSPLNVDGSSLRLAFDVASCTDAADHHILYGQRSNLPAAPGGAFSLLGSVCGIGTATPYDWIDVPRATDGSNLLWILMVATDAAFVEGSWGVDSRGVERLGPGNGGASGICAVVKSADNSCGHSSP